MIFDFLAIPAMRSPNAKRKPIRKLNKASLRFEIYLVKM